MAIYLFKGKSKLERSHIGQIIMSTTLNTQAKVIEQYGGTAWAKIEGRFLLGASSSYPVNATGGEKEHTLTIDEIPSHHHYDESTPDKNLVLGGNDDYYSYSGVETTSATGIKWGKGVWPEGGGQSHNNMPPYKAVYIWERTA